MNARFADTSFFVAVLSRKDRFHSQSVAILQQLDSKLTTTDWVLNEVGNSLSKLSNRHKMLPLYDFLSNHPLIAIIPATRVQFEQGLRLFDARRDKSWSLTDCISFEMMKEHGLSEALTNDHHFEQAGFKALLGAWRELGNE